MAIVAAEVADKVSYGTLFVSGITSLTLRITVSASDSADGTQIMGDWGAGGGDGPFLLTRDGDNVIFYVEGGGYAGWRTTSGFLVSGTHDIEVIWTGGGTNTCVINVDASAETLDRTGLPTDNVFTAAAGSAQGFSLGAKPAANGIDAMLGTYADLYVESSAGVHINATLATTSDLDGGTNSGFEDSGPPAAPTLSFAGSPAEAVVGVAFTALTPTLTGSGVVVTAADLPPGLSINSSTAAITGTPTDYWYSRTVPITATNGGGSVTVNVVIESVFKFTVSGTNGAGTDTTVVTLHEATPGGNTPSSFAGASFASSSFATSSFAGSSFG